MKRNKLDLTLTLILALVAGLAWTGPGSPLRAGTVFMKNGYIIQGPVVKQEKDAIVLGWDNGKMTIHKRFYQTVVLTTEEKAMLERIRQEEQARQNDEFRETEVVYEGEEGFEQLPESFNEMVTRLNLPFAGEEVLSLDEPDENPATTPGDEPPVDPVTDPGDTEPAIDVTRIDPPVVVTLAEREVHPRLGLTFQAPTGWAFSSGDGFVRWVGEEQSDGFKPNVLVLRSSIEGFAFEVALEGIREGLREGLKDFDLAREEQVTVGGREGYLFEGTGGLVTSADAREESLPVSVTKIVVPDGERFFLFAAFTSAATDPEVQLVLGKSIQSAEWFADAEEDEEFEETSPGSVPAFETPVEDTETFEEPESPDPAGALEETLDSLDSGDAGSDQPGTFETESFETDDTTDFQGETDVEAPTGLTPDEFLEEALRDAGSEAPAEADAFPETETFPEEETHDTGSSFDPESASSSLETGFEDGAVESSDVGTYEEESAGDETFDSGSYETESLEAPAPFESTESVEETHEFEDEGIESGDESVETTESPLGL